MAHLLNDLIAATFTPLHNDGSLNLDVVPRVVEHLLAAGVAGLYVVGSTGEGPSLTTEERCRVAEAYLAAAQGRMPVVVQVGHNSVAEARRLADHAQQNGAHAISATPPSYFKPDRLDTLIDCMAHIAAAAPGLPFYYYHIPSLTGVAIDAPEFLLQGSPRIPTLAGIKFTSADLDQFLACVELEDGRFNMLFGRDEMLLAGLTAGAQGAVGTTYNFAAPLYRRLMGHLEQGELAEARRQQGRAVALIRTILQHGGVAALKAAMNLLAVDCGPVRLPLRTLDPQTLASLRRHLQPLGDGCL